MDKLSTCVGCRSNLVATDYKCGICKEALCKKCSIFPTETFSYYREVPSHLVCNSYCSVCYDEEIAGATQEYLQIIENAKKIIVYSKNESKLTRLFSRKENPYIVEDCLDEDDALMRMSFWAVMDNFNCLIDVTFAKKKVVVGSYKKFMWSGRAVPVNIDLKRVR